MNEREKNEQESSDHGHHHESEADLAVQSMGRACAITVSDRTSDGTREDTSGRLLAQLLVEAGFEVSGPVVVPDGVETVAAAVQDAVDDRVLLVVTTGGTGIGPRDLTPEASKTLITRDMPGMAELLRREGAKQTPYAAVSRGLVGVIDHQNRSGGTLVVNLPGRPAGVQEGMDVLAPLLPHVLSQLRGYDH
ncbi:MAG: MogA/MoaB family molybdenum cofactor biosynthesis protein [Ornithinimicrobium sp.]